jgi:chaperonin GroEL (HSP60 family)
LEKLIAEAMEKVKKDGVITVEEAKGTQILLMLLKVCNLIEDIFLHTLLQMQKKCKQF